MCLDKKPNYRWRGHVQNTRKRGVSWKVVQETDGCIDGAKYHDSIVSRQFVADHADKLTTFRLPSYSPDFNPIEFLWKKIKIEATHLRWFPNFDDLKVAVHSALDRIASAPHEILRLFGRYRNVNLEISAT